MTMGGGLWLLALGWKFGGCEGWCECNREDILLMYVLRRWPSLQYSRMCQCQSNVPAIQKSSTLLLGVQRI